MNLYAYCGNNPVTRADEDGEIWHIVAAAAIGAVSEIAAQVISNAIAQEDLFSGVGMAALTGALCGAVSATGVKLAVEIALPTVIAAVSDVTDQIQEGAGSIKQINWKRTATNAAITAISTCVSVKATAIKVDMSRVKSASKTLSKGLRKGVTKKSVRLARKTITRFGRKVAVKKYYPGLVKNIPKNVAISTYTNLTSIVSSGLFSYYGRSRR